MFVSTLLVLFVGVCSLQSILVSQDVFENDDSVQLERMTLLPNEDIAAIKMAHAAQCLVYDVGLFGNSRSVQVGKSDISLGNSTFFNFSVPGTSIRQSVVLLEELAEMGKVPRTVLISFDNAETQYFGNPCFPRFRPVQGISDIIHGVTDPHTSLKDLLIMGWRYIRDSYHMFKSSFSFEQMKARIGFCFPGAAPMPLGSRSTFKRDGSRPDRSDASVQREQTGLQSGRVLLGYLRHDLERIALIKKNCNQIIIYESPLEFKTALRYWGHPSSYAKRTRDLLRETCGRLGLECYCYGEPARIKTGAWVDATHAPPDFLGRYIAKLIASGVS